MDGQKERGLNLNLDSQNQKGAPMNKTSRYKSGNKETSQGHIPFKNLSESMLA